MIFKYFVLRSFAQVLHLSLIFLSMEIKTNLNLKYKNIRQYAMPLRCLSEFCKLISSSTSFVSQTMHDVFLDLFDEGMHYISNYPIVNERVIASHIDLPAPKKKKTSSFLVDVYAAKKFVIIL